MTTNPRIDRKSTGVVVVHAMRDREPEHEHAVHVELGKRLGVLQGLDFAGIYDPGQRYEGRVYFFPTDTLIGTEYARLLGINNELDLFGGVAPHPFIATKAITHSLVGPGAYAPQGWSTDFTQRVHDSVLCGFTVFTLKDAKVAGERLLRLGLLRIKPVRGTGGRGQVLISSGLELDRALAAFDTADLQRYGLVLEEHLEEVATYSVGKVRVADMTITYFGVQRLTPDNRGEMVYGGSDLIVARGGFEALLALNLPEEGRRSIAQAQVYDNAASRCFRGFFASRRNYDVACGLDARRRQRSGVLEQSWRAGGASGAEVIAIEALQASKSLSAIRTSTFELFGKAAKPPANALLLFSGEDDVVGHISKYVRVESYGDAQ
ncbi:MAG TPA: DUF3182 family protein [Eoetvoesiella sp.]